MIVLEVTQKIRVDNEAEVAALIESVRQGQLNEGYELTKHTSTLKTKKVKGEIVDAWYVVSLTKKFHEERE